MSETGTMTRQAMESRLTWNSGGYSLSGMAGLTWGLIDGPDIPSTVAVSGPPSRYTDDELSKIVAFAEWQDARYDKLFRVKRGCNGILFDKLDWLSTRPVRWMVKKFTWESGYESHATLDDAITWMRGVIERYD